MLWRSSSDGYLSPEEKMLQKRLAKKRGEVIEERLLLYELN
jgi:hypothetical protein